ncbi:MAG: 7-cyano-7-deazaguanine synthase [Microgenomates group bacterium]
MKEFQPKSTEQTAILKGLQREPTNKAVLLYSGGADSTAAGLLLQDRGYAIHPIFFDYGQTASEAEQFCVEKAAPLLGFEKPHIVQTDILKQISHSALLGENAQDDTNAWVPGRNSVFMLLAGIYAHQIDADGVSIGFMASDQGVFGDSNMIHHKILETLLTQTLSRQMDVYTPLQNADKRKVLEILAERGAIDLTVSCWNAHVEDSKIVICGTCANCEERNTNLQALPHPQLSK